MFTRCAASISETFRITDPYVVIPPSFSNGDILLVEDENCVIVTAFNSNSSEDDQHFLI
jgi:hypothetical protein